MATGTASGAKPNQYDEKYLLPNGQYDYDAWLRDYYAWGENQTPDATDPSKSVDRNPRPVRTPQVQPGDGKTGAGETSVQVPVIQAPAADAPKADAGASKPSTPKAWWESDDDRKDTATGNVMGGKGAPKMPESWMAEVGNFRYADQKKINKQYEEGVTDTQFRDSVHQARQARYGENSYAHGYDWADKDTPDNDHRSAANAKFFENPSWLDELDQMDPKARSEYMRALQAADPESAAAILDDDRARRTGKK